MFKFILARATGTDADKLVFASALQMARPWSSHLEFLHVRADVQRIVINMAAGGFCGATGLDQIVDRLNQEAIAKQEEAERRVRKFCRDEQIEISEALNIARPTAAWRAEMGDEPELLAAHGRAADLLVIGRAGRGDEVSKDILDASLVGTGRPMLIASTKPVRAELGTVVIAWKDTREAARAVAAAGPFIERAARVIILSVEEDARSTEKSCDRLCHAMLWHNPGTTVRHLKQDGRPPVETMLEGAATAGADLLVMGGYSHSRVREVLFGGFTRRVLTAAELPVLMAH